MLAAIIYRDRRSYCQELISDLLVFHVLHEAT